MADGGVVREFHADEGWGVIDGPAVPGGCWVHFSAIAMAGFRHLVTGQVVSFRAEAAEQDGFAFRAVKVWTGNTEPPVPPSALSAPSAAGGAYQSSLVLTFDDPPDERTGDHLTELFGEPVLERHGDRVSMRFTGHPGEPLGESRSERFTGPGHCGED